MISRSEAAPAAVEVAAASLPVPLDWAGLFGNTRPVELEIGTGKGRFLIERADRHPSINYLGIEQSLKWMRFARGRIDRAGLFNVRLVCTEARHFLERYVPDRSLRAIHIYFPDPWPKRRHQKRRLFRAGIGPLLAARLLPDGRIHLATDRHDYFTATVELLHGEPGLELLRAGTAAADDTPLTHFEVKYRAEGRPIYLAELRRSES